MQTCVGIAGISSQPCCSWRQRRGEHGQKQEPREASYGLGSSGKSPGLAPVAKLLCFDPFASLETSCGTGALPLALLSEHFTALSVFFLLVCCREMLGSSTLSNVAARVYLLGMSHPEGPRLLAVQPPCSRQGSSGVASSRNGAAEGTGETRALRGVEFRPPKAPASGTTIEASIHLLHCYTSSELCNPMQHFLSRKRAAGFPLSRGNPHSSAGERVSETAWPALLYRLLLLRAGRRELLPQGKISLFHYWANKLNSLLLYLARPAAEGRQSGRRWVRWQEAVQGSWVSQQELDGHCRTGQDVAMAKAIL